MEARRVSPVLHEAGKKEVSSQIDLPIDFFFFRF